MIDINQIAPVLKPHSGCDYHRIILPLQQMGFDFDTFRAKEPEQSLKDCKILWFNRTPAVHIIPAIEARQAYGFKILLDLDDYWHLSAFHYMRKDWEEWDVPGQIVLAIRNADAISVTTERLANVIKPLNPNVFVIPNGLPFGKDQFVYNEKTESDFTRFIFAGGSSHIRDCRQLIIPLRKLEVHPVKNKSKFIVAGYDDATASSRLVWDKIEGCFNPKKLNYERRYTLPLEHYMEHYDNGDVSIVPLESNYFTSFKSNLKIIEAGCKRMPIIVSKVPPYSDEDSPCLFASNTREWMDHIKYCANNKNFVTEKGLELEAYVKEKYDLSKINQLRLQLFEKLMQ